MSLYSSIVRALTIQAALAALLVGVLLGGLSYAGQSMLSNARAGEQLDAFSAALAEAAGAGRPVDRALGDLDARGGRLAGRVSLVTPEGKPLAGPRADGSTIAERPVQVGGRTVALARLIRWPESTAVERWWLLLQIGGIAIIMACVFGALFTNGRRLATRWSQPVDQLHRMSRSVVQGEHDLVFEEEGTPEILGTMRNLRRIASQFSRLETARRTWLVAIADELKRPTENMGEHFISLCELDPPLPRELLTAIEDDTRRLIHMSADLSAVALADLGRLPVQFEPLDARELVADAIYAHQHRAEAQNVRLSAGAVPEDAVPVKWDRERMGQLLGALLDNSLRYTPRHGRIQLGIEPARSAWKLLVDDSAPGIDVTLAQQLFEPFYRSPDRRNESAASGLGLATARAIVEAHHGRIEAGRSPIGGLRITVTLPAEPPSS